MLAFMRWDFPLAALLCWSGLLCDGTARAESPPTHSSLQARRGSPVPLQGTIAAQLRFTEYSLGSFHAWHARGIPSSGAESVWRVVHSLGQARGLTALLGPDEEFNDTYYEQFLLPDGRLTPVKPISFDAALAARRKVLGPSAELLRLALLRATPDPAGPGADVPSTGTQSLTVFAASPEEVAALLVLGDGREPSPAELVAALRHFRVRYGVALLAASAYSVEFVAERPPKEVAALRELAGWFVLFCPAALGSRPGGSEDARRLLTRLASHHWTCSWFSHR